MSFLRHISPYTPIYNPGIESKMDVNTIGLKLIYLHEEPQVCKESPVQVVVHWHALICSDKGFLERTPLVPACCLSGESSPGQLLSSLKYCPNPAAPLCVISTFTDPKPEVCENTVHYFCFLLSWSSIFLSVKLDYCACLDKPVKTIKDKTVPWNFIKDLVFFTYWKESCACSQNEQAPLSFWVVWWPADPWQSFPDDCY